MSEVKKWERKVKGLQTNVDALKDKKRFYERETDYYQQQLEEAEMMLDEARYLERKEESE